MVLLSDGQANQGKVEPDLIARDCTGWLERGVSTTTVGLGRAFNEELMIAMAKAGGGQQYYGQRAEDLYDAFDEELSLLQAMMMRGLRVRPVAAAGVLVDVLGQAKTDAEGWSTLSDLAWGAEVWVLLRLHLSAQATGADRQRTLLGVSLQAQDMDGKAVELHAAPLALPVRAAAKPDGGVGRSHLRR